MTDPLTGATHAGHDAGTPPDPLLELARAGDWPALARLGRFALAAQTLRIVGVAGERVDPDVAAALAGLTEVEAAVRVKAVARAQRRLAQVDPRPPDLVDWDALAADLEALATAVAAIDGREIGEARTALETLASDAFAAERSALLGTVAVLEGDEPQALAHFEAALARDPQHVRALTNRGNVRLEAGDVDGAIADYQRAIAVDEGFANAHHNLGVAYRRKGQLGQSVAALRRAQRHAARRDADEARASLRGGRRAGGGRVTGAGAGRWRRWLVLGAVAGLALWWLQRQGLL